MRPSLRARSESLADRAYNHIWKRILSGSLQCGDPVSPRQLAEELGMSLLPVSEALLRLETEGLIERVPRAASRVRIPTPAEIRGHYVVREALETHSARLFAELASDRQKQQLQEKAALLDAGFAELAHRWSRQRLARVERAHLAFHMWIARATRCRELVAAIERSRVLFFNWLFSMASEFLVLPPGWHTDLGRVLARGTPTEAAEAMRTHVRYRQQEVIERFRRLSRELADVRSHIVRKPQRRAWKGLQLGSAPTGRQEDSLRWREG